MSIIDNNINNLLIKTRPINGGGRCKYLEVESIIDEMNNKYDGNWTSKILNTRLEGT